MIRCGLVKITNELTEALGTLEALVLLRDRKVLEPISEARPATSSDWAEDTAFLASAEIEI